MLKTILGGLAFLVAALAVLFWWLLLSGSTAPKTAPDLFPIADWRAMIAETEIGERPTALTMIEIGSDVAPGFAAQAGAFGADYVVSYTSFVAETPGGQVIIGGAIDEPSAIEIRQSPEAATFYQDRYDGLLDAMVSARAIVMTHEHVDHVMAIARHPDPAGIADHVLLNADQKSALAGFTLSGALPEALQSASPALDGETTMIAPGIVIAPASGHTPGSQVVYISLQNGTEYLLIGDIVWTRDGITALKTRPVLTQFLVFDPNEDRTAVKQQVRALHDLAAAEPDLIIMPSHDQVYLRALINDGKLSE